MQLKSFLAAALAFVPAMGQMDTSSMNLSALIGSNQNLSVLQTLLQAQPDLASGLVNMTNVTLFAPSDAAFETFNASNSGLLAQLSMSPGAISSLLMYHVVPDMELMAANFSMTPLFPHTALNNASFSNVTGGQVVEARLASDNMTAEVISGLKMAANVTQADVMYNNGVVHIIDSLLTIPPNVSATAEAAGLTSLLGALKLTNLTDTIDAAKDITIFAPNNDAFQNISSALGNLTASEVTSILGYHVINGTIAYSSSLTNASIPTMGGPNVTVTVNGDGAVFVNSARVINADILISGGVMHVIDNVLNPNNTSNATTPGEPAYSGASSASSNPLTSGQMMPSSTNTALATTQSEVNSGYPTSSPAPAGGSAASSGPLAGSSSSGMAAGPTGVVGAAALFGGAAFIANW